MSLAKSDLFDSPTAFQIKLKRILGLSNIIKEKNGGFDNQME